MPARSRRRARSALALLAALSIPAFAGISPAQKSPRGKQQQQQQQQQQQHRDAAPSGLPPGFEPVDVEEGVAEAQARETRELEQQVDAETDYRRLTAEPALRARYGSATWSLYEPYH
jgi:hypothetical protein